MNRLLRSRILLATLVAAVALPMAFAAKGERKKKDTAGPDFAAVDKDTNGTISQVEFVAAMKDKLGEDSAKSKFAELDKDKDGSLSKEEFAAGAAPEKKKRKKNKE